MREQDMGPISRQACWDLLRTSSLGRVALSVRALPAIVPVQYYVDGNEIALCLGFFDIPGAAVSDTVIAFAADAIDVGSGKGWTVQVQGTGRVDRTLAQLQDCGQPTSGLIVHLAPQVITGHRVQLCPLVTVLHDAVC